MSECRNCGRSELHDLGPIGQVQPFFLKRVFGLEIRAPRSPNALKQKIRDPRHQFIFVRADENVPFGAFATVMDAVKQSGIANVSIVTQPLDQNGSKR